MAWPIVGPGVSQAILEIENTRSDRIVAVVGGALLDAKLEESLKERLRKGRTLEEFFGIAGPLGQMVHRAQLGYLLELYDKDAYNTIIGIARIRNLFAHHLSLNFNSNNKKLMEAFSTLKYRTMKETFHFDEQSNECRSKYESITERRELFLSHLRWVISVIIREGYLHQLDSK